MITVKNVFSKTVIGLIIFGCIIIAGCKNENEAIAVVEPAGEPKEVLEKYYQWLLEGNYNRAYGLLAEANKDSYDQDDYASYYSIFTQSMRLISFSVVFVEKRENVAFSGYQNLGIEEYDVAVLFDVIQTTHSYIEDKETTGTIEVWVVGDNGNWRIYREMPDSIEKEISRVYSYIGYMYQTGQGKQWNYKEAATTYRRSLEYDSTNAIAHYGLGYSLSELGQYSEAIEAYQNGLLYYDDDIEKSNAYNSIGYCYKNLGQLTEAREHFNIALELDPNNQWAIDNLSLLGD